MKTTKATLLAIVVCALGIVGCESESTLVETDTAETALESGQDAVLALGKARPRPVAWADGEVYQSIVTPATFKPESGNFDELYMGGNGFLDGVPLISESKPGDQDYNGGRWHVNVLKEGVDPDKYLDADSDEDLDLDDFEATADYFACPLQPRRGKNK